MRTYQPSLLAQPDRTSPWNRVEYQAAMKRYFAKSQGAAVKVRSTAHRGQPLRLKQEGTIRVNLSLQDVSVTYGRRTAVDHVNWSLGPGVHALLGPNGAGKSSLLEAIATLRPHGGTISLNDRVGPATRQDLGYLPQDNLPRSRFSVREHLHYMCWLRKLPTMSYQAEVERVIESTGLRPYADTSIAKLSGGWRRRVGISSALVGSPSVVLLDEASAGLDMEQRAALQRIVQDMGRHATVITSTHIVEDVVDIADTISVMHQGRFVFSDSMQAFSEMRTLHDVRARYLELVQG